jgi:hypothetical protein
MAKNSRPATVGGNLILIQTDNAALHCQNIQGGNGGTAREYQKSPTVFSRTQRRHLMRKPLIHTDPQLWEWDGIKRQNVRQVFEGGSRRPGAMVLNVELRKSGTDAATISGKA